MPDSPSRILVVEDQAIVAIDIQSQLESLGYTVVGIASSAGEACDKAAALSPISCSWTSISTTRSTASTRPQGFVSGKESPSFS
ncbi:MAG TPA: hypothetical protein VKB78_05300 [Pirellulales bacterium]|nr:hypothetical protein [Pirellulales bacterium]